MVGVRRVRCIIQSKLIIEFQNHLRGREESEADGVKLSAPLASWHILVAPGKTTRLQIFVGLTVKRDELTTVAHKIGKINVIRRFE